MQPLRDLRLVPTPNDQGRNKGRNNSESVPTFLKLQNEATSGAETWLTVEEAGVALNLQTERGVRKAVAAGKYVSGKVAGNGGLQYRILLGSLPQDAQIRYWQHVASTRTTGVERGTDLTGNSGLSERARTIALLRADVVRLYLEETSGTVTPGGSLVERKRLFVSRFNHGEWSDLRDGIGAELSYATIERWRKMLLDAAGNYEVLAPRYGKDSMGGAKQRAVTVEQGEILVRYALMPNQLKVSEIIRLTRADCDRLNIPCEQTDVTFRRWLYDWRKANIATWTLMREGTKALNDKVLPYVERDRWEVELGDIVMADGHTLNFDTINPWTGKAKRMTLLMVYDFHTGMPLGWEIMPSENTQTIAAAYRRAILRLGFVPKVFYLDNGRAFRSKYFKGCKDFQQVGLTGLFERLGTQVMHAWAYHGQSKSIERWFGTFAELERLMPSYRGTSIATKPAHLQRGDFFHRGIREQIAERTTITIEEAHATIAEWIDRYAERPQESLRGLSPREAMDASLDRVSRTEGFPARCIEREQLDHLMLAEKLTTLYRNGLKMNGQHFYHDALFALEKGGGRQRFMIRYDLQDQRTILVYDDAGRFICEAARTEKHGPAVRLLGTPEQAQSLGEALDHKRGLEATTKRQSKAFLLDESVRGQPPQNEERIRDGTPDAPTIVEPQKPTYKLFESDDDE